MTQTAPAWTDRRTEALIRPAAPIVPNRSIAGRSLMAVVAIMTFLVALTAGGVQLIAAAAADWGSDISREVTIQVRPEDGRDVEAELAKAADAARSLAGVSEVQVYSRAETERLLTPWLGEGLNLGDLPIPRLVVVKIAPGARPDFAALRERLGGVAGASLDDHRFWIERLSTMARAFVLGGLAVLALMMTATALSVVFATHGAMAGNRDVVEVLHFVGAHDSFIANEFQRHFMWLGLKGGFTGGAAAAIVFSLAHVLAGRLVATAGGDEMEAMFGSFAVGWQGYAAIVVAVMLIAVITGVTSRVTVHRVLRGRL
ncbi:cell division protein FtsX [Labrys wisconsinensis]|uniref:Cell division transport system permease protein n=1 Tax=Labrys wisconsinensis TaxID=425677 RepID=A0ABU0JP44_9HYPH|nr:ABC transporter permease [Labrys wisconsinensis]MDQ0475153.1 cell division transport system permease protein [Labrys wisconsinensis]